MTPAPAYTCLPRPQIEGSEKLHTDLTPLFTSVNERCETKKTTRGKTSPDNSQCARNDAIRVRGITNILINDEFPQPTSRVYIRMLRISDNNRTGGGYLLLFTENNVLLCGSKSNYRKLVIQIHTS